MFPNAAAELENRVICVSGVGSSKPFHTLLVNAIPCLDILEKTQCFPFYTYDPDGSNRRENITDWALAQFRTHYADDQISKWDIFYMVYALLHHPDYRTRYAANLKRDLPRIPYVSDFNAFNRAGRRLAALHLDYEQETPYPLDFVWAKNKPVAWRVEKMKLTGDKKALKVNAALTLKGIPPEAFAYKLGSRSALEWVIDQYQVATDKRSGITSDPNQYSPDERYIVDLVGRVVAVSVETVRVVAGLPGVG